VANIVGVPRSQPSALLSDATVRRSQYIASTCGDLSVSTTQWMLGLETRSRLDGWKQ